MGDGGAKGGGGCSCPPQLLSALSVAYFALLGLVLRVSFSVWTKDNSFGLTTTRPHVPPAVEVEDVWYHGIHRMPCSLASGANGYFLQNVVGCMLMAAIARHKKSMNPYLVVGLTSGMCGSLTTFATWMGEEAITIANGFTFQAMISLVSMLCVSLAAYRLGHFMAGCGMGDEPVCFDDLCGLRTCLRRRRRGRGRASITEEESSSSSGSSSDEGEPAEGHNGAAAAAVGSSGEEHHEDVVSEDWALRVDESASWREKEPPKEIRLNPKLELAIVALSFVVVAAFVATCARFGYTAGLLQLAMAPFGAVLRWYLSQYNASATKCCYGIPVWTMVANLTGVLCNAIPVLLIARVDSHLAKTALGAVSTGFAGCLSTVSTLIGELSSETLGGLRVRFLYFLLSFGLAMAIELPLILVVQC